MKKKGLSLKGSTVFCILGKFAKYPSYPSSFSQRLMNVNGSCGEKLPIIEVEITVSLYNI